MPIKNFDNEIKNIDGSTLLQDANPVVMKSLLVAALMGSNPSEKDVSGDEKFKRYELAQKVNAGGNIDLTPEEIVLLKKLVGVSYTPLVVGQVYKILNA